MMAPLPNSPTGHADISTTQVPAHDGAVPPLQDIELQDKVGPDSPAYKSEDDAKLDATVAAQEPEEEEGGSKGVRAIVGGFNISFCTWGFAGSWTVFQSYYETQELRSFTASQIAWIGSVQLMFVYFSSALSGRLFDNGHLSKALLFSCIVSTLGFMMASISSQYWHYILSQGVLLGMGLGSSFSPALACVSSYYRRQRGLANGLLSAGSAIGGLIIPIFLSKMINNPSIGLGWAHRTCGFICLVMQGGAFLLMRQKKTIKNTRPLLDFTVYRQPAYCFTVAALFLCTLSIFYPVFYIQPFAVSKGVDKDTVFYSIAILNGASLFGRIAPLIAADKFGPYNVLVITIACTCVVIYSFSAIQNFGGVAAFSVVNGILYGCYVTVNPVTLANLSDHPSRIGTHIGMSFMMNGLAGLAGPPALGAIITTTGGYWQAAIAAGSFLVLATGLLITGNKLLRRTKGTWRV